MFERDVFGHFKAKDTEISELSISFVLLHYIMFKKTSNESNDPESRVAFPHDQNSDDESREKEPYSRQRSFYQ